MGDSVPDVPLSRGLLGVGRPIPRRLLLAIGTVVMAVAFYRVVWVIRFPSQTAGIDWMVFYAAGKLASRGADPYNIGALNAIELVIRSFPHSAAMPNDLFFDLPVVAWLVGPLTLLGFWGSFAVWTGLSILACGFALRLWARHLSYSWPWVLGGLLLLVTVQGFLVGQEDAFFLLALIGALLLMEHDRPWLAGLCMAVLLAKPDLLWPVPMLLFAVWSSDGARAGRFLLSAALTVGAGALGGFLLVSGSGGFLDFVLANSMRVPGNAATNMAGIPALLAWLPGISAWQGEGVLALGGAAVVVTAGSCLVARHRVRLLDADRSLIVLVGMAAWLACTTYVHFNDDLLVVPLLLVLLGQGGRDLDVRWLLTGVVGWLAVIAAFSLVPASGIFVVLVGVVALVWQRRRIVPSGLASAGLVGLILLPVVYPLTPVAVACTAAAGILAVVVRLGDLPRSGASTRARSISAPGPGYS